MGDTVESRNQQCLSQRYGESSGSHDWSFTQNEGFTVVLTAPKMPAMGSTADQIETPTKSPRYLTSAG